MKTLWPLFLLPMMASAAPEGSVYPNSGSTDARTDEITNISTATSPINPQREEEKPLNEPKKKSDELMKGPYDHKGIYHYIPEVRE